MIRSLYIAVLTIIVSLTAAATSANADAIGNWRKEAVKVVLDNKVYPRSAISREIEGRAMLLINVNADGTITGHQVLQPTGQSVLDREITKLVERVTLPALPSGTAQTSLVVPLTWSLD